MVVMVVVAGVMQEQRFFKSNVSLVISTATTTSVKC